MLPFLLVFAVKISLLFSFSHRNTRTCVVVVNDPFSDLPFLVVTNLYDLRSQIPFLDSPKKRTLYFNSVFRVAFLLVAPKGR